MTQGLPELNLNDWRPTRDSLHRLARIVGKVRAAHMPHAKHWWHITLYVTTRGLTTSSFPANGQNLALTLDLRSHVLSVDSSAGWTASLTLIGQDDQAICAWLASVFSAQGLNWDPQWLDGLERQPDTTYDANAAMRFIEVLNRLDMGFKTFKAGLREESSPVQLFPHHMDLAVNWFSGRKVPGVDPDDEESADEQMNFGFVTGDGSIGEAYVYVTAYPAPEGWSDLALIDGAYWFTEGWTGAILPYAELAVSDAPERLLQSFLQGLHAHGRALMR